MPLKRHHFGVALLAVPLACSLLGTAEAKSPPAPGAPDRIEITGTPGSDDGRDSTASRVIIGRDEIARHGDSSVVDVLRRVPGITVTGGQGRASDIRMRGLGNGYTQILVNGEAMPGGFSLESLPPGQIERIEVARVATVDVGAQGIAGTVNIILRQAVRKAQREAKAALGSRSGRGSAQLDSQFSDRLDGWSYALGAGLSRKNEAWPSTLDQEGRDASGTADQRRTTRRQAQGLADSISLTPKLSPHWGEKDKLSIEAVLRHNRFDDHSDDLRTTSLGPAPRYTTDTQKLALRTTLAQGRLNWSRTLAGGGTLEMRLGNNHLRRVADTRFQGLDDASATVMNERVTGSTTERGLLASGKFRLPYSDGHAIAIGWDADHTRRDESRSQRQASPTGRPTVDLDERYQTTVERLAVFAQDEWDIDDRLSAYAGVRLATLRTRTEGQGMLPAGNRSSVASPVLQLLWKPPALPGDQVRLAVSRSHKAPRAVDLIPRRFVAIDNTPTTPNLQGNPELRPELAWGIDLAFEHALPRKLGFVNINASARRIRDVILDRLFLDQGAWVATKANTGSARVFGLELESRLNLRAAWPGAPDMDWRAGLSRNWSRVDQLPGPNNRLDGQILMSANLAFDWRASQQPLTLGASLAWRGGVQARTSLTQTTVTNPLRTLDLYALWKLNPQAQLRLSIANALSPHELATDTHDDGSSRFLQTTDTPTAPTVRLGIELKL